MKSIFQINKILILVLLSFGSVSPSSAALFDDWTDNQLCEWMDQPSPPGIIENLVYKRLISCSDGIAKKWGDGEPSNTFDGSYSFTLSRSNPSEGSKDLGRGILEILDGKISVAKESRLLDTSPSKYYDTFRGQIDKEGNIIATFEVNALHGKGSPRPVGFSGSMDELQIKGKFDDYFEMIIKIKPLKPLTSEKLAANEKEEDKTTIESYERLATIEVSDAFDGSFSFNFTGVDEGGVLGFGYGTLNIKNGEASISKDSQGMAKPKYQSFEGRVDKNGYLTAILIFNPCPHCAGMVEKLIVFEGNIDKKKLSGMYDDIKLYFYLVKK